MRLRPWHLLLVAAALFVPLQAGALDPAQRGLTVSASLDYCGVAETGVVCKIDTSWSGVERADRYTATVTLADGTVRDFGTVGAGSGGGSSSLFVPYAGNGVYAITITAWGASPDGKDDEIGSEEAEAEVENGSKQGKGDGDKGKDEEEAPPAGDEPAPEPPAIEVGPGEAVAEEPAAEPAPEDPAEPETSEEEAPPAADPLPPSDPGVDDQTPAGQGAATPGQSAASAASE